MAEWLSSLGTLGTIYFWVAVAATAFLAIQVVLMLFSFAGGDAELPMDGMPDGLPEDIPDGGIDLDFDGEVGSGISIFTVKGVTCFFTIGAWIGLIFSIILPESWAWVSVVPAFVAGVGAMYAFALAMKGLYSMQSSGNVNKESLVGLKATVYVSIQPSRTGRGKITLTSHGKYMELDAITDESEKINRDECVVISEIFDGTAVVKRMN